MLSYTATLLTAFRIPSEKRDGCIWRIEITIVFFFFFAAGPPYLPAVRQMRNGSPQVRDLERGQVRAKNMQKCLNNNNNNKKRDGINHYGYEIVCTRPQSGFVL